MNFDKFIEKTSRLMYQAQVLTHGKTAKGYTYGHWRTEVFGNVFSLFHYGTCVLKWKGQHMEEILYFMVGGVSDKQGVNRALHNLMSTPAHYATSWNRYFGHFNETINGVNVNTIDLLMIGRWGNHDFICMVGDKPLVVKKNVIKRKNKQFDKYVINGRQVLKLRTRKAKPFAGRQQIAVWTSERNYKGIFPIVCTLDGCEVTKAKKLNVDEVPDGIINKHIASIV